MIDQVQAQIYLQLLGALAERLERLYDFVPPKHCCFKRLNSQVGQGGLYLRPPDLIPGAQTSSRALGTLEVVAASPLESCYRSLHHS